MGKKYATMHILTNQTDAVTNILLDYYMQDMTQYNIATKAALYVNNAMLIRFTERFFELSESEIVIMQSSTIISVYETNLSFETVEDKAQLLSKLLSMTVIYISNFDDNVLLLGVFSPNSQPINGAMGIGLSGYGIEQKLIDINAFSASTEIVDAGLLETLAKESDIAVIECELSRVLDAPFRVDETVIDSEHYSLAGQEKGLRIYTKKTR